MSDNSTATERKHLHHLERAAREAEAAFLADTFDQHQNGQLRLAVPGEQVPLLPLPDDLIPHWKEPSE